MLFPKSNSQHMNFLNHFIKGASDGYLFVRVGFNKQTKLGITIAFHAAIINVGRPTYQVSVIDDHKLGMQIYNLCNRLFIYDAMGSQSENLDVLKRVSCVLSYSPNQTLFPTADGLILPIHYHTRQRRFRIIQLPCESRNQRHYYYNFELFLLLYCSYYPICQCLHYFVFHHPVLMGR